MKETIKTKILQNLRRFKLDGLTARELVTEIFEVGDDAKQYKSKLTLVKKELKDLITQKKVKESKKTKGEKFQASKLYLIV